jgi:hypothetical protein
MLINDLLRQLFLFVVKLFKIPVNLILIVMDLFKAIQVIFSLELAFRIGDPGDD